VCVSLVLLLHVPVALRGPDQQANPDGSADQTDNTSEDVDDDHTNIIAPRVAKTSTVGLSCAAYHANTVLPPPTQRAVQR